MRSMTMKLTRTLTCLAIAFLSAAGVAPADASHQRDPGRALIRTVLQSGLEALQKDRTPQHSSPQNPLPAEENDGQPAIPQAPTLQGALDALGVAAWKEQFQEETAAYVSKLADKATASIIKRLDHDGEIRAKLEHNMQSVEILCWGVVIYLFCISLLLLLSMKRLLASNRRMRDQLDRMASRLDALAPKN